MFLSRYIVIIVGCIHIAACAVKDVQTASFASTNGDNIDTYLHLPAGKDVPHPVVIDLHGCNGIWQQRNQQWLPWLADKGFAVLQIDSFNPRGTANVCDDVFRVAPMTRVMDIVAAINFIADNDTLDEDRIFLMGMSHGGTTALLTNMYASRIFSRLRGVIAYYPYCPGILPVLNTDLLILIGALDDWTPADFCQSMQIVNNNSHRFELFVYPEAYHSFDVPGVNANYYGHQIQYHPGAAADSFERVRKFLQERL